ncbi:minor tail protein [Mycobacterium phage Aziz]|uniref:Uncharacterized protein n=1 Tax=Mycobacterium phage Aziz TaxID=2762281 RepID=A0A7G8LHH5_9CAUD|nr:minor tail protein [Mycobacterium phage Aziz]ASR75884.1 hypothetical protein SEA_GENEVAB15_37 [Mycobacterium phage GenevaB15]QNJ56697.1 hypothetical protein SEA_AZIZ_37 [Mycobacterium phage Aziz]
MYHVQTDHQVVGFGIDHMKLFDARTGEPLVSATRVDGVWTVEAIGIPNVTAEDRPGALTAMTEQALASLGGTGYSTLIPHELWEMD